MVIKCIRFYADTHSNTYLSTQNTNAYTNMLHNRVTKYKLYFSFKENPDANKINRDENKFQNLTVVHFNNKQ